MPNEYTLEYGSGNFLGLDITPTTYHVHDEKTGEHVGEVTAWSREEAGEKIAEGNWQPGK